MKIATDMREADMFVFTSVYETFLFFTEMSDFLFLESH